MSRNYRKINRVVTVLIAVVAPITAAPAQAPPPIPVNEIAQCVSRKLDVLRSQSENFRGLPKVCSTRTRPPTGDRREGDDWVSIIQYSAPDRWIVQSVAFTETIHDYRPWYGDLSVSADGKSAMKAVACRIGNRESGGGFLSGIISRKVTIEDERQAIGECLQLHLK
jgi:hypothetical protein